LLQAVIAKVFSGTANFVAKPDCWCKAGLPLQNGRVFKGLNKRAGEKCKK